ncbi:MAG TPA: hypothetical protein VFR35_12305, partial [Actinoplanes sp.]|nr:hypothetical protein [Actinoplanes sp.]
MTEERMRWELATLAGRLRTLEAERDDWRTRCHQVEQDRNRHREHIHALRHSRAFRVGRAIATLARPPVRMVRRWRGRPVPAAGIRAGKPPAPALPAHAYIAIGLTPE